MNNSNEPSRGKILIHDLGLGAMTGAEITERAIEIAQIAGRVTATKEDLDRARAELFGRTLESDFGRDDACMDSLSRDPSDPPAHHGRQTPNCEGADEKQELERLVAGGVEEAQHDQMLAALRRPSH